MVANGRKPVPPVGFVQVPLLDGDKLLANPGEVWVHGADTVTFQRDETRGKRLLWFPGWEEFGSPQAGSGPPIAPGLWDLGLPLSFNVHRVEARKVFFYAVYDVDLRRFAVGGSNPKIIVEP